MNYKVSGSGFSWQVTDTTGAQHGQTYRHNHDAFEFAKRLDKADQICIRPCLCCCNDFQSEGPHNRMCIDCRKKSEDMG